MTRILPRVIFDRMAVIASAAERGVLLLKQESKVLEAEIIEEGEDLDL